MSAIQITTASAICAVVDMLADGALPSRNFVSQDGIPLSAFLANRFGRAYAADPLGPAVVAPAREGAFIKAVPARKREPAARLSFKLSPTTEEWSSEMSENRIAGAAKKAGWRGRGSRGQGQSATRSMEAEGRGQQGGRYGAEQGRQGPGQGWRRY